MTHERILLSVSLWLQFADDLRFILCGRTSLPLPPSLSLFLSFSKCVCVCAAKMENAGEALGRATNHTRARAKLVQRDYRFSITAASVRLSSLVFVWSSNFRNCSWNQLPERKRRHCATGSREWAPKMSFESCESNEKNCLIKVASMKALAR